MKKFWKRIPATTQRWLIVLAGGAAFLGLDALGLFSELESLSIDSRFRLREKVHPGPAPSEQLLVLGVTERGLRDPDFGRWPWSRSRHGDLLALLGAMEPKAVCLDILFTEVSANPDDDAYLAEAAGGVPTVVGAMMSRTVIAEFADLSGARGAELVFDLGSPRQLRLSLSDDSGADLAGAVTVKGVDPTGEPVSETISVTPGLDAYEGSKAFAAVSEISMDFGETGSEDDSFTIEAGASPSLKPLTNVKGSISSVSTGGEAPLLPFRALTDAAEVGFVEATPDPDGVWRRAPLIIRYEDQILPTLSTRLLMTYWDLSPGDIEVEIGRRVTFNTSEGPIRVPINAKGEMKVNYRSFERFESLNVRPYSSVFRELIAHLNDGQPWPDVIPNPKDKIVFVGVLAEGIDIGATPLSPLTPKAYVHAHAVDNILRQDFVRTLSPFLAFLIWVGLTGLSLRAPGQSKIIKSILIPFCGLIGFVVLAYVVFITSSLQVPMAWTMTGFAVFHAGATIKHWYASHATQLKFETEMRAAGAIQMGMLPKLIDVIREQQDELDIAATLIPAKENSGDFYDVFWLAKGRLCLVIGDVCGKGIVASTFMVMCKTIIHGLARPELALEEIVARANTALSDQNELGMFATVIMAVIEMETGEMAYTTAGHHGPVSVPVKGKAVELTPTENFAVGPIGGMDYGIQTHKLEPGEIVFLCTDGVTEAFNVKDEQYGMERTLETLTGLQGKSCQQLLDETLQSIRDFAGKEPQSDDISMLAFAIKGGGKSGDQNPGSPSES